MSFIVCENLVKIYKIADIEVVALQGLDLRIDAGEMMAVIGPSGSGKSTLMNILGALDQPSAGRVRVGDHDLARMGRREQVLYRRREIGFVWQQTGRNLIPYLSAQQNVELPMALNGVGGRERQRRARDLLEQVGLGDRLHYRPDRLSGGQQQRVAIAVAMANQPRLLLADEPTGQVDSEAANAIFDALHGLNAESDVTIVIVTHDPTVAERVNRVVGMRDGRTITEILRRDPDVADGRQEFATLDRSGRLQLPDEFLQALGMEDRVQIEMDGDHVRIYPDMVAKEEHN